MHKLKQVMVIAWVTHLILLGTLIIGTSLGNHISKSLIYSVPTLTIEKSN